eukprot:TRINITY_DN4865_c0_g2_i2.p1 TRINITY_DN4865_c0_g2~~TRINITY_DN4865_c0_g2_i2.p1  ORF type:complete len:847 (-),score=222.81 TRINITY_DN4865_c0_g2_i2:352-2844(-)
MAEDVAKKEARDLLVAAERQLYEEQVEACIGSASKAVQLSEKLGDSFLDGHIDALRTLIEALNLKATMLREKPEEALRLATESLNKFQAASHRRGEACMLLCLASSNHDKRGRIHRQESVRLAQQALSTFRELDDRKSEASTLLVMAMAHFKEVMYNDMLLEAQAALEIYRELGDKIHTAKALNVVGLSMSLKKHIDSAAEKGREALELWRELGLKRQEAIQTHAMALWFQFAHWPSKALPWAEQALTMFRELGPVQLPGGKDYHREALCACTVLEVLRAKKQLKTGMKFAKTAMERFSTVDSKFGQALTKFSLSKIHIALDQPEKAMDVVDEARELFECLGDKRWSARLLLGQVQAHLKGRDLEGALRALDKAIAIAEAAGDIEEMQHFYHTLIDVLLLDPRKVKAAQRAVKEARKIAEDRSDRRAEGLVSLRDAMVRFASKKHAESIQLLKMTQELFQDWPDGESHCLYIMAEVYEDDNQIEAALQSAAESLAIRRDSSDTELEALSQLQISKICLKAADYEPAMEAAAQALQLGKTGRNSLAQIEALLLMVQTCNWQVAQLAPDLEKSQNALVENRVAKPIVDRAVKFANEALQLAGKAESRSLRALVLFKRAEIMVLANRGQAALRDIKEAIAIFRDVDEYRMLSRSLFLSGVIKHAAGTEMTEEAEADIASATEIANAAGDSELLEDMERYRKAKEERQQRQKQIQAPQEVVQQTGQAPTREPSAQAALPASEPASAAAPVSKGLDPTYVRKALATMVKDAIASEDDDLELDSPFMDAGMDSLSSVALMSMVAKEFQMSLSPSLVFDFPTLRAMEDHLVAESKSL